MTQPDLGRTTAPSPADLPQDSVPRLDWSRWARLESSFSLLLVPAQPGVFVLAEEVVSPGESAALGDRRMLAVFQVSATPDLAYAVNRLFAPASPLRPRLIEGRCFLRFAVVSDPARRQAACRALQASLTPEDAPSVAAAPATAARAAVPPPSKSKSIVQDADPGDESSTNASAAPGASRTSINVNRPGPLPFGF